MTQTGNEHGMRPNRHGCWRGYWSSFATHRLTPHGFTHRLDFAGHRMCWPSHGYRGVRLFRPVTYDVLQLSGVWHVVARLVLSQDLHQRTQLQPPLLLRDPVTEHRRGNLSTVVMDFFCKNVLFLMFWWPHVAQINSPITQKSFKFNLTRDQWGYFFSGFGKLPLEPQWTLYNCFSRLISTSCDE